MRLTPTWLRACAVITASLAVTASHSVSAVESTSVSTPTVIDQHQTGTKYSPLTQITKDNVNDLEVAWTYYLGDLPSEEERKGKLVSMEDHPSMIDGNLVVCGVSRRLAALDPATGEERWTFDPPTQDARMKKCRGISHWVDSTTEEGAVCHSRIFLGTADYKLFSIDAKTGKPCEQFGDNGMVQMQPSEEPLFVGEVAAGSNPAVVGDVIVVGSSVGDNQRVNAPSGRVLAFDARTGEQKWQFDPVPRDPNDPAMASWGKGTDGFGQGNVWSSMAVDPELDMVYLPTTSPSNDFYGGERPGDNRYTTSVVALKGSTGEVVWHYQIVHHNVFDYDLPTRPMLIDYPKNGDANGEKVPALLQNTKMGLVFIFDRRTGEPLIPIEERPVPTETDAVGEHLSPTQPFPVGMPALLKQGYSPDDAWGLTFWDEGKCREKIESLNYGPMYTPPTVKGTIFAPSFGGGPNWGGGAYDANSNIMVVPTNRVPMVMKLIPRRSAEESTSTALETLGTMEFPNPGSPYELRVEPLMSPLMMPCAKPPWAALTAIDIVEKKILWDVPLGSLEKMLPIPLPIKVGTPGAGGPLITASGLVFIGYTLDDSIRAFDLHTGEELWKAGIPAAGTSMPISYEVDGEQYIVIPAGGHSMYQSTMGDAVVAFKLKKK